jgi:2-polyprenyl-3-methyl-5-hydroxy-6-metoxy-1,4-benzoquinol methylase
MTNAALPQHLGTLERHLEARFPYFAKIIGKRLEEFGPSWQSDFEEELARFFAGDSAALTRATDGYGSFALDALKLQKVFDRERQYRPKRYADVAAAVYHSRDYMFNLYLPGILLSQFLWPHHYRQLLFFRERFIPLARAIAPSTFFDVGVGTGFYSKEMLKFLPGIRGTGFDISEHSLAHTAKMLECWDMSSRYESRRQDIIELNPAPQADCITSVEVLEHLEDPPAFLRSLHRMLRPGGLGYLTAAVNAPNADHIYLYTRGDEVAREIREAGFTIVDSDEYFGFVPRADESVPSGAVFVVRKD